jgi:hypothetical protein
MNKILFYSIILSVSFFASCQKEDNKPEHNILVIVDQNGKTTVTQALTNTDISGSFDPSFDVEAATPSDDYHLYIGQFRSYAPPNIVFTSNPYSIDIHMSMNSTALGGWIATGGNVTTETKSGSPMFMNGGTKFMKLTLHNVQFTNQNPGDTIWVSGIINTYRK